MIGTTIGASAMNGVKELLHQAHERMARYLRDAREWCTEALARTESLGIVPIDLGAPPASAYRARDFAAEVMEVRRAVAVDGSQVFPPPVLRLPLAIVQVSGVRLGNYQHERKTESFLMGPEDMDRDALAQVNERRFIEECNLLARMRTEGALHIFDGSFAISFVHSLERRSRDSYIKAIGGLLSQYVATGADLVAHVSASRARDLISTLEREIGEEAPGMTDVFFLSHLLTDPWSALEPRPLVRDEVTAAVGADVGGLYFTYINLGGSIARLEFPSACKMMERWLDVYKAQCIVGGGYPYILDAAHRECVIRSESSEFILSRLSRMAFGLDPKLVSKLKLYRAGVPWNRL